MEKKKVWNNRASIKTHTIITAFVILLASTDTMGDPWPFKGTGSTIYPVKNNAIAMDSEKVVITASGTAFETWYHPSWHYDCHFVLRNTTKKTFKLQIGFPVYFGDARTNDWGFDEENSGRLWAGTLVPKKFSKPHNRVMNFSIYVNGEDVPYKITKGIKLFKDQVIPYDRVYRWLMAFGPEAVMDLHVSYDLMVTTHTRDWEMGPGTLRLMYILSTGALWKGPIGSFDMEIHFLDDVEFFEDNYNKLTGKQINVKNIDEYTKIFENQNRVPFGKLTRDHEKTVMVWHLENFEPEGDLDLQYIPGSATRHEIRIQIRESAMSSFKEKKIEELYYLFLAALGKSFENPLLKKRFENEPWYIGNPNFSIEKIRGMRAEKCDDPFDPELWEEPFREIEGLEWPWGDILLEIEERLAAKEVKEKDTEKLAAYDVKKKKLEKNTRSQEMIENKKASPHQGGCACEFVI